MMTGMTVMMNLQMDESVIKPMNDAQCRMMMMVDDASLEVQKVSVRSGGFKLMFTLGN